MDRSGPPVAAPGSWDSDAAESSEAGTSDPGPSDAGAPGVHEVALTSAESLALPKPSRDGTEVESPVPARSSAGESVARWASSLEESPPKLSDVSGFWSESSRVGAASAVFDVESPPLGAAKPGWGMEATDHEVTGSSLSGADAGAECDEEAGTEDRSVPDVEREAESGMDRDPRSGVGSRSGAGGLPRRRLTPKPSGSRK